MTDPIKISEQGRALSCDEYDANLDIVRDRANHTGTQSCTTLNDFEDCVSTSTTVNNIETDISNNTTRIVSLENSLLAGGSIATDLANLEAELRVDITQNTNANQLTQIQLDALEIEVDGNRAYIDAVENNIDNSITTLQNQITVNTNTNTLQDTNISNLQVQISTLNTDLLTEISDRQTGDADLQGQINAEIGNRISGDNNIVSLLNNEINDRIADVNSARTDIQALEIDLENQIATSENGLQVQIDNLTGSLSSAIPTGCLMIWMGTNAGIPPGFLLCDGTYISRTTYANLFAIIGTHFGSQSASDFRLPIFDGIFPRAVIYETLPGDIGGIPGNLVTLGVNELPSHSHGAVTAAHAHNWSNIHSHSVTDPTHGHGVGDPGHTHDYTDSGEFLNNDAWDGGSNYSISTITKTTTGSTTGIVVQNNSTGISVDAVGIAGVTENTSPATTIVAEGGGSSFSVQNEYFNAKYIIKT